MTELIALRPGRPPILTIKGCRIYVAVHDEYYIRTRKEFRQRLRLAHPDMKPVTTFQKGVAIIHDHLVTSHQDGRTHLRRGYLRSACTIRRPQSPAVFRKLMHTFLTWKAQEVKWYAQFSLDPPPWR